MHHTRPQEVHRRLWWQAQWRWGQWQSWGFYQGYPQEGWQGSHCRLPGFQCRSCLVDITTLQWTRDVLPPQVPQGCKGLLRQKEEEEGREPCQEELQPQGAQGWWPPLGCHPLTVPIFCRCP